MIEQVVLLTGGDRSLWPDLSTYSSETTCFIGIDKGALHALELNIPLSLAIGDFDSVSCQEMLCIKQYSDEVIRYPSEKDDTDTELGVLWALKKAPDATIIIIGATGGRMDHMLSNFFIAVQPRFKDKVNQLVLKDSQNTIRFYTPGHCKIDKESDKRYVSVIPLTDVKSLSIRGMKYILEEQDLVGPCAYVSNEFLESTATVSFSSGIVSVIQSKDK